MLQLVDVGPRALSAYEGLAPERRLEQLRVQADALEGARVLHLNATPYGGGVSEMLRSSVPLLKDMGIEAEWKIIRGEERFFEVTKKIHNALQGRHGALTESEREAYFGTSRRNAELLDAGAYDFIVVHDPQPLGIRAAIGEAKAKWIWRCHIDTSSPDEDVWSFLLEQLEGFDAAVFTMPEFVPPSFPISTVDLIPPAIDPLSPKNISLGSEVARQVLEWIGVDLDKPLVTQISRFDTWKDPFGVIEAFRIVREEIPDLQLALVGSMALDDPEGWDLYRRLESASREDPAIHVFTNLTGVGSVEVNAFQRESDVIIQKSIREGFGLVVSEALWKGTPVVAGCTGGIPLQMADGAGGALVTSIEECAKEVLHLLRHPDEAEELGKQGRDRVQEYFLLPRLLLGELELLGALSGRRKTSRLPSHDPACGLPVDAPDALSEEVHDRTFRFCSKACRERFLHETPRCENPMEAERS